MVKRQLINSAALQTKFLFTGLWFSRVKREDGTCYFISNWSDKKVDEWVTVQ